jgi:hypothetical protein
VLLGLLALGARRPERDRAVGLGARLGSAGRPLALLPIATAFAVNAALLRDPALVILAVAVMAVLLRALPK